MIQQSDLTGRVFTRLTVLRMHDRPLSKQATVWICRCNCGALTLVRHRQLIRGNTRSCGCLKRELDVARIRSLVNGKSMEWRSLLISVYDQLGRFPKKPFEIYEATVDDWGDCQPRRFWRALRALRMAGHADRLGQLRSNGSDPTCYVRGKVPLPAEWFAADDDLEDEEIAA